MDVDFENAPACTCPPGETVSTCVRCGLLAGRDVAAEAMDRIESHLRHGAQFSERVAEDIATVRWALLKGALTDDD